MTVTDGPIKAIETRYAGCRFRSRLEARWAVFFDSLEVEWEYEPQGYTIGPAGTPYLPDFWLPTLDVWAEVKGVLDHESLETLIYAASAAGLPPTPTAPQTWNRNAFYPERHRLLLLGNLPEPGVNHMHFALDVVGDDLIFCIGFSFGTWDPHKPVIVPFGPRQVMNPFIAGKESTEGERVLWTHGMTASVITQRERVLDAYRAARSARFEHGEQG